MDTNAPPATAPEESVTSVNNQKKSWKRHVSRRNAFIAAGLVALVVVAGLLAWRGRRMGYTKEFTIQGWHTIVVQSDDVAGLTKGDANLDKASALSTSLRKLDGTIKDQKVQLTLIPKLLNDRTTLNTYSSFVATMGAFSTQVAGMSDDVSAITEEDVTTAQKAAAAALQSSDTTKQKLSYLSEEINPKLFEVVSYLEALKKLSDEAKAAERAEAKKAEQDTLNKSLVELSMAGFMDGYIAGNATKMKRYMTDAFIKEYNFNQLSAEQRKYVYPVSYRVVSNTKQDANTYSVQVNVINKYRDPENGSSDQYTTSFSYSVIYVDSAARWLVNTEKSNS